MTRNWHSSGRLATATVASESTKTPKSMASFVGGDTSQWEPNLYRNTTAIYPYVGKQDWNLTTAMADEAIDWMSQLNELAPDKPFFCYYVPGGTHAPHHPTPEWIKKISDMKLFDEGWNKLRERIFAKFAHGGTGQTGGAGLGLAISRQIVERFDGELALARSRTGAKFTVRLAVASREAAAHPGE